MTIYPRTQWVKFRDAHKDTPGKGAVSGVSVGDLIDVAYKSLSKDDMKKQFKANKAAVKGMEKYHSKVKKKHPAFAKDFKSRWLDEFSQTLDSTAAILKPAEALKANIVKAAGLFGAINGSSTAADWANLHTSDPIRLISMNLGMIIRNKPELKSTVEPIMRRWASEANATLPENVKTPEEIAQASVTLRKGVKALVDDSKAAGLL